MSVPVDLPGFAVQSVAYHSDGTVLLYTDADSVPCSYSAPPFGGISDGNTVVGCGWDPTRRRFFFTLNGELVFASPSVLLGPFSTAARSYHAVRFR